MRRHFMIVSAAVASVLASAGMALADPVNPGERIGQWVYNNVAALFAPILAVFALYYLAKRQFTQFLSFAIFAVIAALFIFAGADVKDAAVNLARWVIGK